MTKDIISIIEDARKLSDSEWENRKKELLEEAENFSVEKRVYNSLKEIGVPAFLEGYTYLKRAIILSLNDPQMLHKITYGLYVTIAEEFEVTWQRVERNIRTAIEVTLKFGNMEKINEMFGFTLNVRKGKVTNSNFIAGIVECIYHN